jgi:hypothetical protein
MTAKWWLVTWTTYGSWLPGDPRGFQTWHGREYVPPPPRYAKPGEPTYDKAEYEQRYEAARKQVEGAIELSKEEQQRVCNSIVDELIVIPVVPAVLSVGNVHVHLLAIFGKLLIRPTVGRLKARATRELNEAGFIGKRVWSKNCHMVSKDTADKLQNAYNYVAKHVEEGCLVHRWKSLAETLST